jgi:hypothetical protein
MQGKKCWIRSGQSALSRFRMFRGFAAFLRCLKYSMFGSGEIVPLPSVILYSIWSIELGFSVAQLRKTVKQDR